MTNPPNLHAVPEPNDPPPKAQPAAETYWPSPNDPMGTARRVLEDYTDKTTNLPTIRWWQGSWWKWAGPVWREVKAAELDLYQRLEKACYWSDSANKGDGASMPWLPNRRKVGDVEAALQAITFTPDDIATPSWLIKDPPTKAGDIIACQNGLLAVSEKKLHALNAGFFNQAAVAFNYDATAPEPTEWLKFLKSVWPDDKGEITCLQEWFGYLLSGRTDQQKILMIIGPPRSGKGTIGTILKALLGDGNVAAPTLAALASQFGKQPLIGKPLAIITDARFSKQTSAAAVETLLTISGEDPIDIDRKFRDAWTGVLPTRFVMMSNELPSFHDSGGAIAKRKIILQMTQTFLGQEDTGLKRRLLAELPGILNWSLEGLERLNANGSFNEPESSSLARQVIEDTVSPMQAFLRDRCEFDPAGAVEKPTLFNEYQNWCEQNGHQAGALATFARHLLAAAPGIATSRPREGGARIHVYRGIKLRNQQRDPF